jgi:mRNA interferase MazF
MISTQLDQEIPNFDEMITTNDADFAESGLKASSLIRISRLAVVNGDILLGRIR